MSYRIGQATILGALLLLSACSSLWGHSGERELQRLVETGRFSDAVPLASRLLADAERSGDLAEVVKASVRLSAARRLSGDPRSALPVAGRALAVGRQSFPESALLADALSEVATVQQNLSARRESGELYREALSLRERILGPEDPSVARELTRLARVEFDLSRYDEALDLVARALSIQDRVLGADHDDVAESLRMKGLILTDRGRFDEAEAVLQRALRIKERLFGIDSVNIGAALFALARMEATSNRTGAAARDFERARRLYTAAYGPDHPQVLHQTYGLAYVYQQLGRRTEARQIYQEVLQAQERTGGPDDAARANLLLNMANNEIWAGDLVTAERLLKRAIHALNEISSAPPALVAQCMTALGNVYADRGLADDAVVLDRRALALFEQTLGTSNPLYAGALASLGLALELQGEAKEAQSLYARAVAKFEAAQGDQRKYSAGVLVLMSASKRSQGRYKEARVDAERATALLREALGEDHPDLAGAMLTLAPIEAALGREDRAEKLLREALSIGPGQLDPGHQVQSAANRQLGILLWKRGAMDEAADHFDHAQGAVDRRLGNALAAVSERRQQELLGELAEQMNAVVSFHLSSGRRSATASLALRSVLGYKGRALEAAGKQWEQARRRASPEDQRLLDELRDVRSQIAQFAYASDSGTTGNESKREALERQRFSLEERLATRVPINTTSPDINAIRAEIPEDAALVEIARYKRIAPRLGPVEPSGRDHYVAFVLHREGEIGVEDLGPASRIDRAVRSLRKVTGHPDDPNFREHARALDRMVFQPIERWMKTSRASSLVARFVPEHGSIRRACRF